MSAAVSSCHTCYGAGEIHGDAGPRLCPDCAGNGRIEDGADTVEARLRAIESEQERRELRDGGSAEVRWLAFEVRRARGVLQQIAAHCDEGMSGETGNSGDQTLARIRALAERIVPPTHPARPSDMLPEDR